VEEGVVLAVGPVRIPDYLHRPQIMTRSEGNEIRMVETERWGRLPRGGRLPGAGREPLLPARREARCRGSVVAAVQTMAPFRNRLAVEVLRFEARWGGR